MLAGGQVRAAVGRLYRRFRSERPEGSLGDAALEVLTYLHKHGPQTLTELSERGRVSPASMNQSVNRLTSAGYAVRAARPPPVDVAQGGDGSGSEDTADDGVVGAVAVVMLQYDIGFDPLRLAGVFGISEHTAIRYAVNARQLLGRSRPW